MLILLTNTIPTFGSVSEGVGETTQHTVTRRASRCRVRWTPLYRHSGLGRYIDRNCTTRLGQHAME